MYIDTMLVNSNKRPFARWAEIEDAIRELDGGAISEIGISSGEMPYMLISGGNDAQYVVQVSFDNKTTYLLVNPESDEGDKCSVVLGGQIDSIDSRNCADLTLALRVARVFAESGKLDRDLTWDKV